MSRNVAPTSAARRIRFSISTLPCCCERREHRRKTRAVELSLLELVLQLVERRAEVPLEHRHRLVGRQRLAALELAGITRESRRQGLWRLSHHLERDVFVSRGQIGARQLL